MVFERGPGKDSAAEINRVAMMAKPKSDSFSLEQGKKLMTWLNPSADFQGATKWFDGFILLVNDGEVLWLKVYSGRVIDVQDKPSPFGFAFGGCFVYGSRNHSRRERIYQ